MPDITLDKLPEGLRDIAVGVMDYTAQGRAAYGERLMGKLSERDKAKVRQAVAIYFPDGLACPLPEVGCLTCRDLTRRHQ
jgi:hypothetical protein